MPTIRIQLYGPVRLRRGAQHLLLGGAFRRAIVARLALHPGEPVSTDELVSGLWTEPPSAAVSSLRAQVSRLRQGELGAVIGGGRGGYVLDGSAAEIDAERLRGLGVAASPVWDPSLASGRPLDDLDGFPFVLEARTLLETERSRAIERFAETRLAEGDARTALSAVSALLGRGAAPRESTIMLAAEASARLGRSTEALDLLDGVPAAELDALRQAIVRHDPAVTGTRADAVARRGIPLPVSSFVGRGDELDSITAARRSSRLITLVGPGGVGKTRLAVESARRVQSPDDDEQWMLELAPLTRPEQIVEALADRLGDTAERGDPVPAPASRAHPRPDSVVLDAVARRLGGRRVLLVLDNAEHLREAVAELAVDLLGRCAGLTVLVTTREALRVPGEKLIPVSPMSIDDSGDAVTLFAARAADAAPGFELTGDAHRTVRAICARLDGLPLALELAAARLDVLGLDELRGVVEAGAILDEAGSSGGRHASLRSTIGWSVDLLGEPERSLLRQLAWFAGAFDLEAVEAVCTAGTASPRDLVLALARKSLVAVDVVAGRRVYRLLESVKLHLRELDPSPASLASLALPASLASPAERVERADLSEWRARHLAHFARWVVAVDDGLRGPHALDGHARLDAARADLQLALEAAHAAGDRQSALMIAGGLAWHWFRRGSFVRARDALDRAFALDGPAHPETLARAYFGSVMTIHRSGDEFGGERYAFEGYEAARASGDPTWRALFAACTGMWRSTVGDVAGHDERMREAVGLLEAAAPWAASEVHIFRGIAKGYLEKPAQALEAFDEAHRAATACGHRWAADAAAQRLAHLYIKLKRGRDAVSQVRVAVRGAVADGDMHAVVTTLHTGAAACALLERHGDGAALLGVVDTVAVRFGYDRRSVEPRYWSGYRDRVREGLQAAVWRREYERGTRLGIGDAIRLLERVAS